MVQNCQCFLTILDHSDSKWYKIVPSPRTVGKMSQICRKIIEKLSVLGLGTILYHFESKWSKIVPSQCFFDNFGPFWTVCSGFNQLSMAIFSSAADESNIYSNVYIEGSTMARRFRIALSSVKASCWLLLPLPWQEFLALVFLGTFLLTKQRTFHLIPVSFRRHETKP
jgi:hypothetical protein